MRPRVCAAILRGNEILMVRHEHDGRKYWTFPGGKVEPGETPEQAVLREVRADSQVSQVIALLGLDASGD